MAPSDIAGTSAGVLVIAGVGWAWTLSRATRAADSSIRAVYQTRGAVFWTNVIFGVLAFTALVALIVAGVIALN